MDQYAAMMQINRELQPGESLLWAGQPRQGVYLRGSDALQIPFSLAWCGFAFFWEYSVVSSGGPIFFKLWGIPFVLVGIYLVIGRFFADSLVRSKAQYAVTSNRILIISGLFNLKTTSIGLANIPELSFVEGNNGGGTISFSPMATQWWAANSGVPFNRQAPQAFELAENARQTYNIILKAQSEAKRPSA
ncbi:hypothetical protein [Geothrix oryzisoli]|uniref:hypothetical protein n=1 Tax=Geothrix oryzisoli TaxID=2922721 RepID=UPI001FAC8C69|nr:hypothetical protein [Geothrix oryzisoli]